MSNSPWLLRVRKALGENKRQARAIKERTDDGATLDYGGLPKGMVLGMFVVMMDA